ncbi:unnamed protein product [Moneuplotes crassus]|uniref:Uncharacterized protein n=1 Tax=Euplotes crassus TaxID=5936 RepID=A0AAD2D5G9_EUPCR|nr:unnamed protein product [Moneuplotes crassus]
MIALLENLSEELSLLKVDFSYLGSKYFDPESISFGGFRRLCCSFQGSTGLNISLRTNLVMTRITIQRMSSVH